MSFLSSLTRQTMMRPALLWSLSLLSLSLSLPCQAESLQQVLEQVRSGSRQEQAAAERQENLSRQSLEQVRSNHKKLQQQLTRTQANNLELEDQLLALQQSLKDKQAQLNAEKASLDGVFRAIQEHEQLLLTTVAPHSLWRHDSSGLAEIATDQLGLQRLQALWTALTEQSVLAAKPIVQSSEGLNADGTPVLLNVTEYGPFNALSDKGWVRYLPAQQSWQLLAEQPKLSPTQGSVWLDPSFGKLLQQAANGNGWFDKLKPAGIVGVFIGLIALIASGIALNRLWILRHEKRRLTQQQASQQVQSDNALGRVMLAATDCPEEQLEARLNAAVLSEVPRLTRGTGTLAVLAGIPPLLGLLGTVGGMIETFDVITRFGSNNTELLSGGIAEALLTTQLGLMTAIPLLLLHCAVKSQSRQLTQMLEQEAAALVVLQRFGDTGNPGQ
ncbi:hypothetical protein AYI74_09130 [Shewanella algae]|uniref:MotA/TolQ/ExbB proton channel family protein n=1 Tax=Shewanella algae TaxID=38313 RepID=UPI0011B466C9|nr:MotA/TolQ/ExbB proton channel family protein [Shewanella algae]TWU68670.1 hypothetical protein AYI74_09130 [Shewanella algae]